MSSTNLFAAIGTPLGGDDELHAKGLAAHLELQWRHGMHGVLVAGSMGSMQLLSDQTYRDLVAQSCQRSAGRGEVLVGVGDTSFGRTRDRIRLVNEHPADGVAILTPYLLRFTQDELVDYFRALADVSNKPVFLYDLPQVTGLKVEPETVLTLCTHPNIKGIKCSDDVRETRPLIERLHEIDPGFRVIVAQPMLLDMLVRHGVREHVDGIYAVAPAWTRRIAEHAESGTTEPCRCQTDLIELLSLLRQSEPRAVFTALMNALGIPGNYAPRPSRPLSAGEIAELLDEPVVRRWLEDHK